MPSADANATVPAAVLQPKDLPAAPHDWHWPEYGAELAGTVWNVFVGLSAVVFNFAPGMPGAGLVPNAGLRLWITGLIFAGSGSLFTLSRWGRLSGAHINPSVTLGFWAHGRVRGHDLFGYLAAQFIGGAVAAFTLAVFWGSHAAALDDGLTLPGPGYSAGQAFFAEWLMTFAYMLCILHFVSHAWLMRWTPLMNWIVVAGLVWFGARISGASLNPARSFGPALVSTRWHAFWVYLVAPPLGAVTAAVGFRLFARPRRVLTAKLCHSSLYRSIFLPHREHILRPQAARS